MSQSARRTVLKGLVGVVPIAWSKPVVEVLTLPAHAQMSGPITCTVVDTAGPCGPTEGNEFRVFGTVSDGNLTGVILKIEYTNQLSGGGTATVSTTTAVQAGNTFDVTFNALPPSGKSWDDPVGAVTVKFQDQATYGFAECSGTHDCEDIGGDTTDMAGP